MNSPQSHLNMPSLYQRLQPWIVVFSAATFFFFEFIQINMFNALNPYLFQAYHLKDTTQLGQLAANYMYANVLFLFPAGILLDRYSTRFIILLAMLVCVTSTLIFSFTTQLWQAEVCRFITGIGGAFCLLSSVRIASRWFPPKRMALVVGLVVTFAMLGAMVAQTPFTYLAMHFGWRTTLLVDALAGYVMLVLIMFFVQDFPSQDRQAILQQQAHISQAGILRTIQLAFYNPQNWLAGIYASLTNLPVFILGSWGIMYLHQIFGFTRTSASLVTSAMFVGLMVGSPFFGWLSDRMGRRRLPMIIGGALGLLSILPVMYWSQPSFVLMLILFFWVGFMSSAQIISYAVVAESNPAALTGASEGVASVLIMSGGFLIPFFAFLLDIDWQHHFSHGIPLYTMQSFRMGFMLMPIGFALSVVAAFALRETYCRSFDSRQTHD